MTEVCVIRRHEDWEAGAVFIAVRLTAVVPALDILQLSAETFIQSDRTELK